MKIKRDKKLKISSICQKCIPDPIASLLWKHKGEELTDT